MSDSKELMYVFGVLLLALTVISAFGGGLRYSEPFLSAPEVKDGKLKVDKDKYAGKSNSGSVAPSLATDLSNSFPKEGNASVKRPTDAEVREHYALQGASIQKQEKEGFYQDDVEEYNNHTHAENFQDENTDANLNLHESFEDQQMEQYYPENFEDNQYQHQQEQQQEAFEEQQYHSENFEEEQHYEQFEEQQEQEQQQEQQHENFNAENLEHDIEPFQGCMYAGCSL
jgi:hypothetical protein